MLTVIPVHGHIKNYHWGKVDDDSFIARFQSVEYANINEIKTVTSHKDKPLAELWFGAHPSGPSRVIAGTYSLRLDEFLAREPDMIGGVDCYYKYDKKLPFLFKILSVSLPLSLQAHPDKKLAQQLHALDPKNYPDSNHKPELAIALTEFEVLCDFRPANEIVHLMKAFAPFRRIVGEEHYEQYSKAVLDGSAEAQKLALGKCFKALMTKDTAIVTKETQSILKDTANSTQTNKDLLNLISRLDKLYPGDPGVFAPFFLNYLKLSPGQAVYLKANKLHAYIKGECIECMACSDNVVRAGLTTKFRDVETLINMLNYETVRDSKDILLEGVRNGSESSIVSFAPTEEFKVDKILISHVNDTNEFTIPAVASGSFIVVFGGKASTKDFFDMKITHNLALGSAGYVPPKIALKLYKIQTPLSIYRAYC